eukprot:TRINITY_DN16761_c0_g1_i3.p1 TRINITY_DN16761_c0_g1~~TRINITY_DN16761_c0_g1_i3.p1  ORF type:complete len:196 (-),score=25.87 TRINITY_DN16761_c0_g1_i3:182-769(-)
MPRQPALMLLVCLAVLGTQVAADFTWSNSSMQDSYMRVAISLAKEAVAGGGAPYGAVIADPTTNQILVIGRNAAGQNPIWHGEMAAITNLSDHLNRTTGQPVTAVAHRLELYTTAEPCPMCMSAIAWGNFGRVVYGTTIPYIEARGGQQIGIRATEVAQKSFNNVTVVGGVLAEETNPLYQNASSFVHTHTHHVV